MNYVKNISCLFLLLLNSIMYAQQVYLKSDDNVNVNVQVDDSIVYKINLLTDKYSAINISEYLIIESSDNIHTIKYDFSKSVLKNNDTLNLSFIKYHRIDTTFKNSGCLKNEKYKSTSNNNVEMKEYNSNAIEIENLPLVKQLFTQQRIISMNLEIKNSILISHWNGDNKKTKQKCGGSDSTPTVELIYKTQ